MLQGGARARKEALNGYHVVTAADSILLSGHLRSPFGRFSDIPEGWGVCSGLRGVIPCFYRTSSVVTDGL